MELRHLRYFVAVAEELHFGRAAHRLNVSQPPLSRQIQELEAEIGAPLFARHYHRVALTSAGDVYLKQAKRILELVESARQDAVATARGRAGHLRLGQGTHLPPGYLPRVLAALQRMAPRVTVDLCESATPRVLEAVREESIDAGFVLTPSATRGLIVKPLFHERLLIALSDNHRFARTRLRSLVELSDENFVLCRRYADPGYRDLIDGICGQAGFMPRVVQAVEHKQTVLDLVARGLGVSIVPESSAERSRGVRFQAFPGAAPVVTTAVVWREDAEVEVIAPLVHIAEREADQLAAEGMV